MTARGTFPATRVGALLAAALFCAVASAGCSPRTGTVTGKATVAGAPAAGAEVQFFVKAGEERSGAPFAATSTGPDGTFRADLPPGAYFVVARKTAPVEGRDRTYKGEHTRNPVLVAAGKTATADLSLTEMSSGGFVPQEGTGVTGSVSSGGRPVRDAYVYAYPASSGTARGPSYAAFARTDAAGRFRVALREGAYLIVARRKGGENETGAMSPSGESGGDDARPVALALGAMKEIGVLVLHAPREESRRRRVAAGGQERGSALIEGTVVRPDGSPGAGLYVMAYADHRMIGRPFAISGRTGADGAFLLRLPRAGRYFLGARSEYGGPLSPGEWVGTYDGAPDHGLKVGEGETRGGVRITVAEKW